MKQTKAYLGEFEEIVLMAVLRLGTNAYGVTIRQLIEKDTGRSTSIGAVYTTLDRLETKGYLSSWQGGATSQRGGRAKRFFKLEGAGITALNKTRHARQQLSYGLGLDTIRGAL